MSYKIFVQIASYRDPELIPTVLDLFEKAKHPENLNVVIAWQHDDLEFIDPIKDLVQIIDIPYVDSKGVCWARNLIQKAYSGETYTLQLDSHHRFIPNWDVELIEMYNICKDYGSDKPLITTYLPAFDSISEKYEISPWKMNFDRFMDDGPMFFVPSPIENFQELSGPIPARFYSAHFAFSDGKFSVDVQHDPEYYFYGEETNITLRAYTSGYDLYHPHKVIAWHQYNRNNRRKHWEDHINSKKSITDNEWAKLDEISVKKYKSLFLDSHNEDYGLGKVRTLAEYEIYSGINFKNKTISDYTRKNLYPPNPIE